MGHDDGPILKAEEFKGERMWGTGFYGDVLRELDANVISMPASEAYDALAKGTLEGMVFPHDGFFVFKLHEQLPYLTNIEAWGCTPACAFAINKDSWNKISSQDQEVMLELGEGMLDTRNEAYMGGNLAFNAAMQQAGVKFYKFSAEEMAEIKKAGDVVVNKWVGEMEAKGLPAQKILDETLRLVQKYKVK